MNHSIIYNTGYISLIIQAITGILGGIGIFIPLLKKDKILTHVLIMETIVQIIEFIFYLWLVFSISSRSMNVTSIRYLDWFITTPLMLISTILYMAYHSQDEKFKNKEGNVTIQSVFEKDYKIILAFCISNFFMLLFGVLGELGFMDRNICLILGTFFFFISFKIIYDYYVIIEDDNKPLFYFIFVTWALYGVAYLFNYNYRNVSYNILDIFSKNFYGLYIFYKIYRKKIENYSINT